MQILPIAAAGMARATTRLEASAERTATSNDVDYSAEVVEQIEAKDAFSANLAVVRTADEMLGELLDIKV